MTNSKGVLLYLLRDLPVGSREAAVALLKDVAREAEGDRVQLLYGTPIRDWVLLLQEHKITSIDNLRGRLEDRRMYK